MLSLLRSAAQHIVNALDSPARLGEIRDDLSDMRIKTDGATGLRVKVIPPGSPDVPHLIGAGVFSPLVCPFIAERVERVPSGQIIVSRQVLDGEGRERLVRTLRGLAQRSEGPVRVPELETLPRE